MFVTFGFSLSFQFQEDKTVTGELCWAENWEQYDEECYQKVNNATVDPNPDQQWVSLSSLDYFEFAVYLMTAICQSLQILINPFNKTATNIMINMIQNDTDISNKVVGLIFDTDAIMTSEKYYTKPPIMSEATPTKCLELSPYCYNMLEDPSVETYQAVYHHVFIANCDVLDAIVPTYYVAASLWAAMAIFFSAYLYFYIPSQSRLSLQKSLLLLPALKTLEVVLEGIWLDNCPWVGMSNSAY